MRPSQFSPPDDDVIYGAPYWVTLADREAHLERDDELDHASRHWPVMVEKPAR